MNSRLHIRKLILPCAVGIAFLAAVAVYRYTTSPRRRTIAAIDRQPARPFAPRLAGIRFARLRPSRGSGNDSARLSVLTAAAPLLARTSFNDSEDRRIVGVAALVGGDLGRAERELSTAAASGDGRAWCDLAAARLVRGERDDDPRVFLDAASAATAAVRSGAAPAESRFNYALSLERLGLLEAARRAFSESLDHERDPDWRSETARRRGDLSLHDDAKEWLVAREELIRAASRDDRATVADIVAAFPQQARTWGEGIDLSEWGEATLSGDVMRSSTALQRASIVGETLRAQSGDSLLFDAVHAIKYMGMVDLNRQRQLATGHVLYKAGRLAGSHHDAALAISKLSEAASMFHEAGSPMELLAQYHIAGARYDQSEIDETLRDLDVITATQPQQHHYLTLAAQTGWERGLCLLLRGSYSAALETLSSCRDVFARMGEQDMTASFDGLIAESLAYIGNDRDAWRARVRSLRELSRTGNRYRVIVVLAAAAQTHIRREEWSRARAVLDAALENYDDIDDPVLLSQLHVQRSVVRAAVNDVDGASVDQAAATMYANRITDAGVRQRAVAEIDFAHAFALRKIDASQAIVYASRAIDFFGREQPAHLPRIYLERGRLYASRRRFDEARRDFASGLAIIENARRSVTDLELRGMTAEWARDLASEAVGAALAANDPANAFNQAERARAREVLERFQINRNERFVEPMTVDDIRASLAPGAAIVEYADTPRHVVAFVIRRDAFIAVTLPASPDNITVAVDRLANSTDDSSTMAASLETATLLLHPLRSLITGADQLAFIASRSVARVPFGVLDDGGRLLCLTRSILQPPSATIAILSSRDAQTSLPSPLLAISGNAFSKEKYPNLDELRTTRLESMAIAALRRGSRLLIDSTAHKGIVLEAMLASGLIHFSGHIVGTGPDARLLLAEGDSLSSREIASLSLQHTALVVVAGCSASASRAAEGATDIATAFLIAGVPTVVATTGDLDDEIAPELFVRFHRALKNSKAAADAIRELAGNEHSQAVRLAFAHLAVIGGSRSLVEPTWHGGHGVSENTINLKLPKLQKRPERPCTAHA